jgi:hypothetical protein
LIYDGFLVVVSITPASSPLPAAARAYNNKTDLFNKEMSMQ